MIWGLPALVGALAVLPRLFAHDADIRVATPHVLDLLGLVRDPLAWQVTAYFGLISALAYAVFNWGPSMLQARGLDATESGLILSVCYISQTFAGLLAPIVAGKWRDQRLIVAAMVVLTALLLGFVYAPVSSLKLSASGRAVRSGWRSYCLLCAAAIRIRPPSFRRWRRRSAMSSAVWLDLLPWASSSTGPARGRSCLCSLWRSALLRSCPA